MDEDPAVLETKPLEYIVEMLFSDPIDDEAQRLFKSMLSSYAEANKCGVRAVDIAPRRTKFVLMAKSRYSRVVTNPLTGEEE